jgi:hypothetical protein
MFCKFLITLKKSLVYLVIAYVLKIVLQLPLTLAMGVYGPLAASTIAFMVMGHFAFRLINKQFNVVDKELGKKLFKIFIDGLIMLVVVVIADFLVVKVISDATKISATIVIIICGLIGVAVYGFLSYKDGSLKILKDIRDTKIY